MRSTIKDAAYYIDGVLNRDITVLSRAITLIESNNETHAALASKVLEGILPFAGNSFRLGITGVPGVGKSSFIEVAGQMLVKQGKKLAVLAVDPSSAKSHGSILGDKTRMETLSTTKDVFIRPSPSGNKLGGVTRVTYETILLCEAAGFDFVIVETVGVGQSEVAVSRITDFFLLLMLAGAGDQLQGIKRGIMEMADALVITKADGDNALKAKAAKTEYAQAMHFLQAHEAGWIPPTLTCSSQTGEGVEAVINMLEKYTHAMASYIPNKRKRQIMEILRDNLNERLLKNLYREKGLSAELEKLALQENINPFREAQRLADL